MGDPDDLEMRAADRDPRLSYGFRSLDEDDQFEGNEGYGAAGSSSNDDDDDDDEERSTDAEAEDDDPIDALLRK